MAVGILFGSALVAYAITSLLFTQSQTSSFQKITDIPVQPKYRIDQRRDRPGGFVFN